MAQDRVQCACQFGTGALEFGAMSQCEPAENAASGGGEPHPDFAFIFRAMYPHHRAARFEAVHQFHSTVMLQKKAGGNFADGGLNVLRKPVHRQQQLMLPGFDAMLSRCRFAEVEELPDLAAELREIAVLLGGKIFLAGHIYIVTRYKARATVQLNRSISSRKALTRARRPRGS